MSRFIDKLKRLSQPAPQSIGFRATPASPRLKIQLVASLTEESAESLANHTAGADAGLIRIAQLSSGAQALQKVAQTVPDIPWGGWLPGNNPPAIREITRAVCDFVVFSATNTPLALLHDDEVGKILEVEASLSEGLLRAANALPVDAVLIAGAEPEGYSLTWQHLMLFRRFADLLTKPLLVSIPADVTGAELQVVWEAGVSGVVIEMKSGQPQDTVKELRQAIDKLAFPSPRRGEKIEPRLSLTSPESSRTAIEEEEEE